MFWKRHQPALDRVVMQIRQLLEHYFIAPDGLGVGTFLPDLMRALELVMQAKVLELIEEPIGSFSLYKLQELLSGVPFEISEDTRQLAGGKYRMEVIVEYDPGMNI